MAITVAAVGRALTVGLAALTLTATGWALRPVSAAGTVPDRLLPAVADPTGPLVPAQYPRQLRSSPRPATGAGGAVWDTSRGYPVRVDTQTRRRPLRAPDGSAAYTWLLAGERPGPPPARWSPCAPITVRVNPAGLGPAARAAIRWAFAELQARTGLQVRFGSATGETVTGRLTTRSWTRGTWTAAWQPTWAPVLVFASDAARTPELTGSLVGWTHVRTSGVGQGRHIVSGVVALDLDDLGDIERVADQPRLRMLLLHELGHLVGLGHVDDPDLVMHPQAAPGFSEAVTYRYGDLRGLAVAGRGPC
jgi:hypothetical protein